MLDTTVVPMLSLSPYAVPLTGLCIICIAFMVGRIYGLLFGFFGGILLDIGSGSLGERLFPYLALGYLLGLILGDANLRKNRTRTYAQIVLRRFLYASAFSFAAEIVIYFYQYFHTAEFAWIYIGNCAIRAVITGIASTLLMPVLGKLFVGKTVSNEQGGKLY